MNVIVSTHDLQKAFSTTRIANLKKILAANKIQFFEDRLGRPFTTNQALSTALRLDGEALSDSGFKVEHLK